jgi:hypothetical protein
MNRTDDLRKVIPLRLEAAKASLPVEFVILNYGATKDLRDYVLDELLPLCNRAGVLLTYREHIAEHYHQAHAYNLAALSAAGEYICIMGADTYPSMEYLPTVRKLIADGCRWIEDKRYKGAVCVKRMDFIAIGGYDERFEFYGPEDRDLAVRLMRWGIRKGTVNNMLGNNFTPDDVKVANYRVKGTKQELSKQMRPIFDENVRNDVVVVNQGGWGQWQK